MEGGVTQFQMTCTMTFYRLNILYISQTV